MSTFNVPDNWSWSAFDRHFGDDLEPEQDDDEGCEPNYSGCDDEFYCETHHYGWSTNEDGINNGCPECYRESHEGPDIDAAYDEWLCRQFQEEN